MKKMVLVIAILALVLTRGIIMAQENPPKTPAQPPQPEKMKRPEGPGGMEMRPEMINPNILEQGVVVQNPKVMEEMKRHRETLGKLLAQVKSARDNMKPKEGAIEGAPKNPANPEMNPPPVPPTTPEGGKPEELKKSGEGPKSEIDKIAADVVAEIILHHQNLAQIMGSEKEGIQKRVVEFLINPKMPMMPGGMGGEIRRRPEGQPQPPKPPESGKKPEPKEQPK